MEFDKCASAWLIKRFVDPDAVFKFIPKGELVATGGIPFDTPESKFRRYHNLSAFESILKEYEIHDPGLMWLGKITHDIEITYWSGRTVEGSEELEYRIREIIETTPSPEECFEKTFPIFDEVYQSRISVK
jgi:hypothetical protein